MRFDPIPANVENVAKTCVDCGIHVHRELGPGFKEKIYERAFCLELDLRGVKFECERKILVRYKTWTIPGQKIDLVVDGKVIVELKTVPRLKPLHTKQVLSYLKTMDLRLGLLMNFNTVLLKQGIKRVVL